jgi:uncharacterized small protein (DUF1192 family)
VTPKVGSSSQPKKKLLSVKGLQELSDKIAQLNAAIDEVSSQMKAKDPKPTELIAEEAVA